MSLAEEKYDREIEELEFKAGGVFAISTPSGHKKRWERKKELVRREISATRTPEEKKRLSQKLAELERREKEFAEKLAELHEVLSNQP
ncbi:MULTISPECIES: hypothetical protein [Cyanophyceae]|uniref:hypothetical protein n=1 Tax=Cyanophyceae TaxID=3028117 RepID=UPI0002A66694|nr:MULTISPECIES: hypothetical protein [Cyanophyceae]AFZ33584.1 polypeptide of 976 aa, putative [Gloeocapsa sp. PCC 7428]PPS42086.1 hypothetical protein B1A85_16650 [Chroococcidiopsis sp. TS-821]